MFDHLLNPRSIAIIGASSDEKKIGNVVVKNLIYFNYSGRIYPVNPKSEKIYGLKTYPSIEDINDEIDLAIITLSAPLVPDAVEACVKKNVKYVIVIAGGFSETGEKGAELEREILQKINGTNTRIIGPNTVGIYVPRSNVSTALTLPERTALPGDGKIAFISQSGALGLLTMDTISEYGTGISAFINLGNRIDLSENELLKYFENDEKTGSIVLYIENFKDGREFYKVAKETILKKPIVVLKSGRTSEGAKAASLHTGALSSNDAITDGVLRQAGIIRAYSETELMDYGKVLAYQRPLFGDRIAIITTAGGLGVITADYLVSENNGVGMKLANLSEETKKKIKENIVPFGSAENPIDLTADGSTEQYSRVLEILNYDQNVDGIIVYALFQTAKVDETLIDVLEKYMKGKPMVVGILGSKIGKRMILEAERRGIPAFPSMERTVKAIKVLYMRGKYLKGRNKYGK
ncbi:MAG: CoA-binding protein [Thermoplasmata archaeon]|jgi:acetyl coenzyme A synthetase (ADP forming)-like protein|nr:CoA-binding protein [Euryarchaeota archaeon]MVT14483.1 CoA-binding protein [Euryarchaeota archaeon]MVT35445.1 CoA-binding protein [Euryarchaeota archaeon]